MLTAPWIKRIDLMTGATSLRSLSFAPRGWKARPKTHELDAFQKKLAAKHPSLNVDA